MLALMSLVPSGFSAGVGAAVAAGMSAILLVPFLVVLVKLVKRSGGLRGLNRTAVVIAAAAVLAAVAVSEATSQPSFCKSCHAMRPSVESWMTGAHKGVKCLSCHRDKGFGGVTVRKLEDIGMLLASLYRSETRGLNKPVRDEICLGCHADIGVEPSVEGKVKISHREFIGQGVMCVDCHIDASHAKPGWSKASVMERCSTCHNGRQVSADCSVCHLNEIDRKTKPASGSGIDHGSGWLEMHGVKSQGICTACHSPQNCSKCHLGMPHPDGWSLQHGREALKERDSCIKCHVGGTSCIDCHQLPMPHPAGWLVSHASSAKQRGQNLCLNCHIDRDCASCHFKHENLPQVKAQTRGGKARAK